MAFIMPIMARAVRLVAVSSAYFSQLPALSKPWQSVQFMPTEAAKNPIVAMNWFTGIPLSTWMFLKTCSAIRGGGSGRAWPFANRPPSRHRTVVSFILSPLLPVEHLGAAVIVSVHRALGGDGQHLAVGRNRHGRGLDSLPADLAGALDGVGVDTLQRHGIQKRTRNRRVLAIVGG